MKNLISILLLEWNKLSNMKIHNLEQGTEEWFNVRKGKMTASNAYTISVAGKGLDTYIRTVVADLFASHKEEGYKSKAMERGNELESQAKSIYELSNNIDIVNVGFIEHSEYVGCSPDGLIGDDGGIEIKCVNNRDYFQLLLGEKPDASYTWQVQMCLMLTGRKWWDLVYYNPAFKQSTFVIRLFPETDKFEKLKVGLSMGEEQIKSLVNTYNSLYK